MIMTTVSHPSQGAALSWLSSSPVTGNRRRQSRDTRAADIMCVKGPGVLARFFSTAPRPPDLPGARPARARRGTDGRCFGSFEQPGRLPAAHTRVPGQSHEFLKLMHPDSPRTHPHLRRWTQRGVGWLRLGAPRWFRLGAPEWLSLGVPRWLSYAVPSQALRRSSSTGPSIRPASSSAARYRRATVCPSATGSPLCARSRPVCEAEPAPEADACRFSAHSSTRPMRFGVLRG